jgi:type VI secretion system protein ImpM
VNLPARSEAPGWHGKLPSLGDFASRRLEPDFVEAWDGWLAAGLLALREGDGAGWLDAYLASPSWRFLLLSGVLAGAPGRQGWAGVLMPSVDRVGRYFPFTIAWPLGDGPAGSEQMASLWRWLGRLDELARDALHQDWSVERLEAELVAMALPDLGPPGGARDEMVLRSPGTLLELPAGLDAASVIAGQAQRIWAARARGQAWWQAVPDEAPQRLIVTQGLPPAAEIGRWFGRAAAAMPTATGSAAGAGRTGETMAPGAPASMP